MTNRRTDPAESEKPGSCSPGLQAFRGMGQLQGNLARGDDWGSTMTGWVIHHDWMISPGLAIKDRNLWNFNVSYIHYLSIITTKLKWN